MLYLNGKMYQGVDANHKEVFFDDTFCGTNMDVTFRLWSGLEGGGVPKPSFDNPQMLPALAGVLGGLGAGAAYTFVRYLGARGENGSRIVFYFSAFSCIVCVPFVALDYAPMSLLQLVYLLLAGAFACVGQLGITKAYVCAPAREISVYDYTQVLFAAALGFFVFGDVPDWLSVLGYVLICGAGVGMFLYNRRHDAAHP